MYPEVWIKYKGGAIPTIYYDDPATGEETGVDISQFDTEEIYNWFDSRDFKRLVLDEESYKSGRMNSEEKKKFQERRDEEAHYNAVIEEKRREIEEAQRLATESAAEKARKAEQQQQTAAESSTPHNTESDKPATAEAVGGTEKSEL